jgi:hypothetical protein
MNISLFDFFGYVAIGLCAFSWGNWFRLGVFYRGGYPSKVIPLLWTVLVFNILIYFGL